MDDEVLIIVVFSIVLVFLLILLIRFISNWVRPSKSKVDKGLWESKTNPLSNLKFHLSGVIFIISLIVPVNAFGKKADYEKAVKELEDELYKNNIA